MTSYSQGFQQLISSPDKTRSLLEGESFHSDDFSAWELARKFISLAISHPGTILDIGCGDGFLLRSLQEWQPNVLTPYGVDTNQEYIAMAKSLFPIHAGNFAVLSIQNLDGLIDAGLPNKYDFVYWNVWDDWDFGSDGNVGLFQIALSLVLPGGRLILGFYHGQKGVNLYKVSQLERRGFTVGRIIENSPERWEVVCWYGGR